MLKKIFSRFLAVLIVFDQTNYFLVKNVPS
jgi:hypothetical protein